MFACCLLALGACTGEVVEGPEAAQPGPGSGGGPTGSGAGQGGSSELFPNPPPFQAATGMLRRLTRPQFRNAIRDVLGVEVDMNRLDADSWNGNFAVIGASTVVTSETGVEQYQVAVEGAVNTVFADEAKRAQLLGCTPTGTNPDACVRGFIEATGLRAWRRPLEAAEVDRLATLAAMASTELGSALEGARWATVALLTSPSFLYRAEVGASAAGGALRFTGHEMASRLAFLLWNSLPDQQLLDEAASGALGTPQGIRAAAERMLDSAKGRESVGAFAEEYMRLDRLVAQPKDASLYPDYGPDLEAAMARDMRGAWEAIALDERASVLGVFTTTKAVVNAPLAKLYGLDATGLDATTFRTVSLPADSPRVGILGKAGFLSLFANQKEGSPTLRGKFIREALMCKHIPPPPGDVTAELEEPPANMPMTKRQRLELHRTNPTCAGCHALMDPLGLPLETFDAIGGYRTTDHGLPIDASGEVDGQPVTDARAMARAMSESTAVAKCLVRKYYSYAVGHQEREVDGSVLNALATSFAGSGYQLRQLVLDTVTHDAFASVTPQL